MIKINKKKRLQKQEEEDEEVRYDGALLLYYNQ